METRYKIPKNELESIRRELERKGWTIKDISRSVGCNFKNCLYNGTSLSEASFSTLEELTEDPIEHEQKQLVKGGGFQTEIDTSRNTVVAEATGYLLGDGTVSSYSSNQNSSHYVGLTLHNQEKQQISRGAEILRRSFGQEPSRINQKSESVVRLRLYGIRYVRAAQELGLESGNKVENQISVPDWIYNQEKFIVGCLRGLVDTDGSIYTRNADNRVVAEFTNRSLNLLDDFRSLCEEIDIQCSSAGDYGVQVARQESAARFVSKIQPLKSQGDTPSLTEPENS